MKIVYRNPREQQKLNACKSNGKNKNEMKGNITSGKKKKEMSFDRRKCNLDK